MGTLPYRKLPGPQCARHIQSARLHNGAETPRRPGHQTPHETPRRRRTGHRSSQERSPHGPQLPRPQPRRCHQPHPRRRRLQLPPHPKMDQASLGPILDMPVGRPISENRVVNGRPMIAEYEKLYTAATSDEAQWSEAEYFQQLENLALFFDNSTQEIIQFLDRNSQSIPFGD
jgi:hypothetical protein